MARIKVTAASPPRPLVGKVEKKKKEKEIVASWPVEEDGSIAHVDHEWVMQILHVALRRRLSLQEVRYLEQCVFQGPATIKVGRWMQVGEK